MGSKPMDATTQTRVAHLIKTVIEKPYLETWETVRTHFPQVSFWQYQKLRTRVIAGEFDAKPTKTKTTAEPKVKIPTHLKDNVYYSIKDIVSACGITEKAVWAATNRQQVPFIASSGGKMYLGSDIKKWRENVRNSYATRLKSAKATKQSQKEHIANLEKQVTDLTATVNSLKGNNGVVAHKPGNGLDADAPVTTTTPSDSGEGESSPRW